MRIKRFRAENYRIFRRIDFIFPEQNCILIVDENERGKSSLLLGILSCLYCHRKDPSINADSYLELEFTLKGNKYTVVVEGDKKRVYKDERDITPEIYRKVGRSYRYLVGETLFGLNEDEFMSTALVKQHELIRSSIADHSGSLVPRIQSIVELSAEGLNSAKAIELLRKGIEKNFPRTTLKNRAKGDARQELKALNRKLNEELGRKKTLLEELSVEDSLINQYERLLSEIKKTEQHIKLNELKRNLAILKEEDEKGKEIARLKEELSSLMPFPELELAELLELETTLKGDRMFLESSKNSVEKKTKEAESVEKGISELEEQLKTFKDLSNRDIDQALKLQNLSTSLKELDSELEKLKESYKEKTLSFPSSLEEFEKLHHIICKLSAQDLKLLEEYPERQKKLKDLKEALSYIKSLKKKSISLIVTALVVVALSLGLYPIFNWSFLLLILLLPLVIYYKRLSAEIRSLEEKTDTTPDELDGIEKKIILNEEGLRRIRELYRIDCSDYLEYLRLVHDYKTIKELKERIESLKNKKALILSEINSIYLFKEEPSPEEIEHLIKDIRRCSDLKQRLAFQRKRLEEIKREAEEIKNRIEDTTKKIRNLTEKKLLISTDSMTEEELFQEAFNRIERAKRAQEIKRSLSEIKPIDKERYKKLKEEAHTLLKELSLGSMPEVERPSSFYEDHLKRLASYIRELYGKKNAFESRRTRLLTLKDQLTEIDRKIEALQFRIKYTTQYVTSVEKAISLLQGLSLSNYSVWAERLNRDASKILYHFTGKQRRIVFGKDLNFRVLSEDEELTDTEAQWYLSGGTLEQLYLAIRITVSEYIAPDIKLPLILDEPFAHADDERFLRAMQFLTGSLSEKHQIIVLSCHRKRHLDIKDRLRGDFCLIERII